MYIGLIDDDLRGRSIKYPNLEIMKLSSYHKNKRDLVELVRDYRTYTRFSKLYLRRNGADNDLPALLLSKARDKCEYGGFAFSNGLYIPLEKEIEKSLPDVTIYDKIKSEGLSGSTEFFARLKKELIRLETAECLPNTAKKSWLIYDKQAFEYPLLDELINKAELIEFVEPQHFDDFETVISFATQPKFMANTKVMYDGLVTPQMVEDYKKCELKTKIRYKLIPETWNNIDFFTGVEIINGYFNNIENVMRKNKKYIIQCPFSNRELRQLIEVINEASYNMDIDAKLKFMISTKSYNYLQLRHKNLLYRIKSLWRYNNNGKT